MLDAQASAAACKQLLTEMAGLTVVDELDRWAYRCLPTNNRLTTDDARQVEQAFAVKLTTLGAADAVEVETTAPSAAPSQPRGLVAPCVAQQANIASGQIDKPVCHSRAAALRDKTHLRFVARQPCLICGRLPCDAHHLRFGRGLGLKVSDEFTVPLCRGHHREVHRSGIEVHWWNKFGINATGLAGKLWLESHPQRTLANTVVADIAAPSLATLTESEAPDFGAPKTRRTQNTKRSQISGFQS